MIYRCCGIAGSARREKRNAYVKYIPTLQIARHEPLIEGRVAEIEGYFEVRARMFPSSTGQSVSVLLSLIAMATMLLASSAAEASDRWAGASEAGRSILTISGDRLANHLKGLNLEQNIAQSIVNDDASESQGMATLTDPGDRQLKLAVLKDPAIDETPVFPAPATTALLLSALAGLAFAAGNRKKKYVRVTAANR